MSYCGRSSNLSYNETNTTETPMTDKDEGLYITYNVLTISVTICIMFSMGTGITLRYLKTILKRPVGPTIGFVSQCLIMPACCCGYALLLNLPDNIALGMVLTGSLSGGAISNVVTFWSKADIILSICMTTISTTVCVGFLPLNMFIYTRFWIDDMTQLPYVQMVITVVYLWIAVTLGYLIGRRWPKTIPYFTRIGSVLSLVLILTAGFIQGKVYPELFDLTWETYLAAFTMPPLGFVIGYGLSLIFCLKWKQSLAIGFETGLQNTALGLTIVATSFPQDFHLASCYSQFIILYTTFMIAQALAVVFCIWVYVLIRYREFPWTKRMTFGLDEAESDDPPPLGREHDDPEADAAPTLVSVSATADGRDILEDADSCEKDAVSATTSSTSSSSADTAGNSPAINKKTLFELDLVNDDVQCEGAVDSDAGNDYSAKPKID